MKHKIRFSTRFLASIKREDSENKHQEIHRIRVNIDNYIYHLRQIIKRIQYLEIDRIPNYYSTINSLIPMHSVSFVKSNNPLATLNLSERENKVDLRQVFNELSVLFSEKKGAKLTSSKDQGIRLVIPIRQVEVDDGEETVNLGDFNVEINPLSPYNFSISGLRNNTETVDGYIHPHVAHDGGLCLGDGVEDFQSAINDGRLTDAIDIVESVLRSYGSPYEPLHAWYRNDYECVNCNNLIQEDYIHNCDHCSECFCDNCVTCCRECGSTSCDECLWVCDICENKACSCNFMECNCCKKEICHDCLIECGSCGNIICTECVEEETNVHQCYSCGTTVCNDCIQECYECGVLLCNNCTHECCENCKIKLCKRHKDLKCLFSN